MVAIPGVIGTNWMMKSFLFKTVDNAWIKKFQNVALSNVRNFLMAARCELPCIVFEI